MHGTHLCITGQPDERSLRLRYMHNQSYGFNSFEPGDSVEIVNVHTLLGEFAGRVTDTKRIDDYEWTVTLDRVIGSLDIEDGRAVENISATPSLRVANSYFTLVPTRGILVTTRRRVEIYGNIFDRIPMPAIHISDDVRGWYESGPVRDVTIKGNRFVECGSPVVCVNPETDRYEGPVHTGIRIIDNEFIMNGGEAIGARGVADVTVSGNKISGRHEAQPVRVDTDR